MRLEGPANEPPDGARPILLDADQLPGTTRGSLSAFLLSSSWRYRLVELRNILANETDIRTAPVPKRLRFLYPIMRLPLWVSRHIRRGDTT